MIQSSKVISPQNPSKSQEDDSVMIGLIDFNFCKKPSFSQTINETLTDRQAVGFSQQKEL